MFFIVQRIKDKDKPMILICEPQCVGFEHVEVNTALMISILTNINEQREKVVFLAEESHLVQVQMKLTEYFGPAEQIEFRPINVPTRNYSSLKRLPQELELLQKVFAFAKKRDVSKIVFTSVTSPGLLLIKVLTGFFYKIRSIIVLHAVLESILHSPVYKITELFFWFKPIFLVGNNKSINYVVLSPKIKDNLSNKFNDIGKYVKAIHHPYIFANCTSKKVVLEEMKIKFGVIGVGHSGKGTPFFFRLAEKLSKHDTNFKSEFLLVGHIVDQSLRNFKNEFVNIVSDKPLVRDLYNQYAESLDYILFFYNAESYQLTASGALLDAIAFNKPIIALRNSLFEYYFDVLGNIGYLCDDYSQVEQLVIKICNDFPQEEYITQQANLIKAQELFRPENVGNQIMKIINSI